MRGLASGGIGAMHRLAQHTGLVEALDRHVEVLKVHLPYHESDHVLGIAYNVLCGGTSHGRRAHKYLGGTRDQRLFDEIRYFFHLTNDRETSAAALVFLANDRCNQENLIDQRKTWRRRGTGIAPAG